MRALSKAPKKRLKPIHVLLVEDNPADVLLLREELEHVPGHGLEITPVGTLREALNSLEVQRFDVAILDLSLPDAEGLEVHESIQSKAPALPVIVLSARKDDDLAIHTVRSGAEDYLVKGQVDGELLIRSVRHAMERRQSLTAVQRSEHHFRTLIENASDLIAVVDDAWHMKFVSPSVERIAGYRASEITGASIIPLIHPADLPRVLRLADALRRGDVSEGPIEVRIQHADKSWRVLDWRGRSLLNDPVVAGLVINAYDITERKLAEERSRELTQRLTAVIDNSPLAIIQVDLDGAVSGWSKGAERILGWSEEEVNGKVLPYVNRRDVDEFREHLRKARLGEAISGKSIRRDRKDGTPVELTMWTALLRSQDGQITGVLSMMADVTEQKALEEQFRHAQKMEAVGRLASGVAHDFNNLLTVITGYGELASRRMDPASPEHADLEEALAAAERAASLTKQLLALSRRQIVQPVLLDLSAVVSSVDRMLKRMVGESVEIVTNLAPALPLVCADRSQVEMVLLNMVVNARDAMPSGGTITIETSCDDGETVVLRISDCGVGMSEETITRIFEPFFTTKEEGKGTGLGLSTSFTIIRQHGGDVTVASKLGIGTTFEIRMAAAPALRIETAEAEQTDLPVRGSATVLLAEDEVQVAKVMRQTLVQSGYTVLITNSFSEAFAVAEEYSGPIHLVLADMILRGGHGLDLARQIRTLRPSVATLFVSGYPDGGLDGRAGYEDIEFLHKPFTPEALSDKVAEVLGRTSRHQGAVR